MRPIKFRAWDKELKTMWYRVEDAYDTIHHHAEDNSKNIDDILSANCFGDLLENDQFAVMQFTGMLDKNGQEIYEGDILGYPVGSPLVVEWDKYKTGWKPFSYTQIAGQHVAVLGNIHENPELLK